MQTSQPGLCISKQFMKTSGYFHNQGSFQSKGAMSPRARLSSEQMFHSFDDSSLRLLYVTDNATLTHCLPLLWRYILIIFTSITNQF